MKKVTIITTTYHHEHFIAETIESILSQTYVNWELLIWDDSLDGATWEVIQKYMKNYPDKIQAWHHSPNKWIVDNMNFLLSKRDSKSKYVAFLEWDDLYTPNNLEEKIKIFDSNPRLWMVYNNLHFIDEVWNMLRENVFHGVKKIYQNERVHIEDFLNESNVHFTYSNLMVRSEVCDTISIKNPTWETSFLCSDYVFFWEVVHMFYTHGIEHIWTLYRLHNNNNSKKTFKLLNDGLECIKYLMDKYNLKQWNFVYHHKKAHFTFISNKKLSTIKNIFQSFYYNRHNALITRWALLLLSCMPFFIAKRIFNIYQKKIGAETL